MRIGLLTDQTTSYGRAVFAGIRRRLLPRLDCLVTIAEPTTAAWERLRADGLDGAIVHAGTPALATAVVHWGGPAVNVSGAVATDLPTCTVDNYALGRLGAEHLAARGCAAFAYVGLAKRRHSRLRGEGFAARLRDLGHVCRTWDWNEDVAGFAAWAASLPAPAGLLVVGDELAVRVLAACAHHGLEVPGRLLVLSATDDADICTLARPTLSGIAFDAARIGFEAAGMLLGLAGGQPAPTQALLLPPQQVVERASTASGTERDRAVAAAQAWIEAHAGRPVGVDDVARAVGVARRSLERRFAALVGRSIYQHLLAVRVERAKRLIAGSRLPLAAVAARCGFATARHLGEAFRLREGRPPASFRST